MILDEPLTGLDVISVSMFKEIINELAKQKKTILISSHQFDQVIAVSDDKLKVGKDVAESTVSATVMDQGRGKKVIVYKYKRKTGYHKKNGHRQAYTQVKIDKINA